MTKKISQLPAAAALDGTELVELEQSAGSVQTTTQDIADLGGAGSGNEITGTSIVSGTITLPGGDVTAGNAHYGSSSTYLYSGAIDANAGNITGSNPAAGHYFYGGRVNLRGGDVTISGNASVASRIAAGRMTFTGGDATVDAGERPSHFKGGVLSFGGGQAVETGVGTASGAAISLDGGGVNVAGISGGDLDLQSGSTTQPNGDGGRVYLRPGLGGPGGANGTLYLLDGSGAVCMQTDPNGGLLIFNGVLVPITGVAVNIAAVHAALVTLGLIST